MYIIIIIVMIKNQKRDDEAPVCAWAGGGGVHTLKSPRTAKQGCPGKSSTEINIQVYGSQLHRLDSDPLMRKIFQTG